MADPTTNLASALEQWLVSLADGGALSLSEILHVLERTRARLSATVDVARLPEDLCNQSEAARVLNVSRQAVHQWVNKGLVRMYSVVDDTGRSLNLVSLGEVAVAANRGRESKFSLSLRRQFDDYLSKIEYLLPTSLVRELANAGSTSGLPSRAEEASRVLREFVTSAMGTTSQQREFSAAGVQMLGRLAPWAEIDPESDFGHLSSSLGLVINSSSGVTGFDSAATSILGLLGCATIGVSMRGSRAGVGKAIAEAAVETWGPSWIPSMLDMAHHIAQLSPSPLTRFTASLSHMGTNAFYRQAQGAGVSIAYGRTPGMLLPQSFYGEPFLSTMVREGNRNPDWAFNQAAATAGLEALGDANVNPFRIFTFERGLLDPSIHGIRRYCFSFSDASSMFRSYAEGLTSSQRREYIDIAVTNLARAMELPFIEIVSIDAPENFDWWKDHIIRASEREIFVGLRDPEARHIAHALLVQTTLLPEVVEAADTDSSMRDRLRVYVKNLEFEIVRDRYEDDLRLGTSRIVKSVTEQLDPESSRERAEREISMLLNGG